MSNRVGQPPLEIFFQNLGRVYRKNYNRFFLTFYEQLLDF